MKILSLELPTNNLKQTERFYSDLLELKILDSSSNSVSYSIGHSLLRFTENSDINRKYHFAFNIPSNKINEALSWISTKHDPIKDKDGKYLTDFTNWNAQSVYFFDNNNNILEFIARHDLNNSTDEPFNGNSILSISEVGIVAPKPLELAKKLIEEHALNYFSKGPKHDDFVVLGDDNGLVVISGASRKWYPTNYVAEPIEMKITLLVNGREQYISITQE